MAGMKRDKMRVCHVAQWCRKALEPWAEKAAHGGPLSDEDVHQLRVATKRVRAAWRVMESDKRVAREHSANLAAAARMVSGERDAAVLRALITEMEKTSEQSAGDGFYEWLADAVTSDCLDRSVPVERGDGVSIRARLAKALDDLAPYLQDEFSGHRKVLYGMRRTAKKCRKSLRKAARNDTPEEWHKARRRVKFVVHQNQIVCELAGQDLPDEVTAMRGLARQLGEWNDLDNLRAAMSRIAVPACHTDDARSVMEWIEARDREMRDAVKKVVRGG
ncbi:CHAD domain-containing protein [Sulfuriroseicoccus oceanibius]|uniref:CHAD domain-containing protein n=1 Tax=Sulfuriroseicoccus oceanibius TaxID=2707525 RepID=A0A6B3LGG4_9BACT|nr:CHAD domain-containing protein [Sulfuriroseicoccus oceanibius]QQL45745.1 CHAD domain-containing protein [Sulfuriroseicoccus oceanibius]